MDHVRILLTGVGCPGAVTVIKALKNNGEIPVHIIGTDMRPTAGGRWFVDEFHVVPPGDSPEFAGEMLQLAHRTRPDVIFPQLTNEVQAWAYHKDEFDCPVMVADAETVEICGDKARTYEALTEVPHPHYATCHSAATFMATVASLGLPHKPVCFKPLDGKGTRGFHVFSHKGDDRRGALLGGRPGTLRPTFFDVFGLLADIDPFPPLMVMEYVEGPEHTIDVYCQDGRILMGFVKTREAMRAGLAMEFKVVDSPTLWNYAGYIVAKLGLSHFANIQFKGGKLLEINPRISTMMNQPDFNMPWLAVKHALGLCDEDELRAATGRVQATTRSVRYFDQIFYTERGK
jgi:carbamoyl-phosphate synthase large subunit